MNILTIAGHLGGDAEERFTPNGQKVVTLRVATKTKKGETIWWRVTAWGTQFDKMIPFLKKGGSVVVVGTFEKPELYVNKQGDTNCSLQITASNIMFSPFGKGEQKDEMAVEARAPIATPEQMSVFGMGEGVVRDDEIPF